MKKELAYYMKLRYETKITPIPEDEGGGFEATIPQLGRYAFVGEGATQDEALKDLKETKKEYFEEFIKKGIDIPEPEESKKDFRGEYLLRMPKHLHEDLYMAAKENEVSLNQYINLLLVKNFQIYQIGDLITKCFQHFWKNMWDKSSITLKPENAKLETFIPPKERRAIGA